MCDSRFRTTPSSADVESCQVSKGEDSRRNLREPIKIGSIEMDVGRARLGLAENVVKNRCVYRHKFFDGGVSLRPVILRGDHARSLLDCLVATSEKSTIISCAIVRRERRGIGGGKPRSG